MTFVFQGYDIFKVTMVSVVFSLFTNRKSVPVNITQRRYSELCPCYVIAIQVDLRKSVKGCISIMTQCIERKLMPNESLGRDLQIIQRSLCVKSLLHGIICVTKCQRLSNCFFLLFFLLATFRSISVNNCSTVMEKLAIGSQ